MKKDCTVWVQSCVPCQQTKVRPYTRSPYQHYPLTSEHLSEIHFDLIGPLPESEGNRYILMCVDRFTRWFTASALPSQDIQTVISAFLRDWVFTYGAPLKCVTDQAKILLSNDWQKLMRFLGTSHSESSLYHPQANAQTERFYLTMKNALKSQLDATNGAHMLPMVILALRTMYREESDASAAVMLYGMNLRWPNQFLSEFHCLERQSANCTAPPSAECGFLPIRSHTFTYKCTWIVVCSRVRHVF